MSEFDCSRIVYSSSATVYGNPPKVPIPETTRLKADSPYGRNKVMCESVIEDLAHGTSFLYIRAVAVSLNNFRSGTHALARYLLTVLQSCRRAPVRFDRGGPSWATRQPPPSARSNGYRATKRVHAASLRRRLPNSVRFLYIIFYHVLSSFSAECKLTDHLFSRRDGTCVRDYLHVLDLAAGHLLALDALEPGSTVFDDCPTPAHYKAYNLGRGQGFSVLQILEAMRAETGFDYTYKIIGRRCVFSCLPVMVGVSFIFRRGDVPDLTADPSLAEKELGFRAKQDLKTMCRDLWNWQTKNPCGYGED